MASTKSMVIVKRFTYRGKDEEFSNRYHLTGNVPTNDAMWKPLADAIIAVEQPVYPASVSFVRAYGYEAQLVHSVAQIDYEQAPLTPAKGTFAPTANTIQAPGDAATTVRWYTGRLSTKGKKIYCRKYLHPAFHQKDLPDNVADQLYTALVAYGAAVINPAAMAGTKLSDDIGSTLTAGQPNPFVTTRTLKRRGKRPLP